MTSTRTTGAPEIADEQDRFFASRFIDHGEIYDVCKWVSACAIATTPTQQQRLKSGAWQLFSTPSPQGPADRAPDVPAHLLTLVDAFPVLMDARHAADYDHVESFPRAVARGFVEEAEAACKLLEENAGDRYVKRFLALVIFRARRLR